MNNWEYNDMIDWQDKGAKELLEIVDSVNIDLRRALAELYEVKKKILREVHDEIELEKNLLDDIRTGRGTQPPKTPKHLND